MFVTIEKQIEKRRPSEISWIYKNPVLKDYDESDPDPWKYELAGEKIPREPKWKLVVKLRHTYRQDGKVKGKSTKITTISFWNFIDSWLEYRIQDYDSYDFYVPEKRVYSAFENLVEATGAEGDAESMLAQLSDKLRPWQEKALAEYKQQCIEFNHAQDHIDAWKDLIRQRLDAFVKKQKEQQRREEEERRRRRSHEEFYRNYERMTQGAGSLSLSDDEKVLFKRLWKIGYRTLSIQLHPDKGGDLEQMKVLNGIKEKLGDIVR